MSLNSYSFIKFSSEEKHLIFTSVCVCTHACQHIPQNMCRGKLAGVSSLLSLCEFKGSNSGH